MPLVWHIRRTTARKLDCQPRLASSSCRRISSIRQLAVAVVRRRRSTRTSSSPEGPSARMGRPRMGKGDRAGMFRTNLCARRQVTDTQVARTPGRSSVCWRPGRERSARLPSTCPVPTGACAGSDWRPGNRLRQERGQPQRSSPTPSMTKLAAPPAARRCCFGPLGLAPSTVLAPPDTSVTRSCKYQAADGAPSLLPTNLPIIEELIARHGDRERRNPTRWCSRETLVAARIALASALP